MQWTFQSRKFRYVFLVFAIIVPLTAVLATQVSAAQHIGQNTSTNWDDAASADLTLIQAGDFHGHLTSRPQLRDGVVQEVGGLARAYSKIQQIRASSPASLLFNIGDTLQGGAEALYTRGDAMVNVLDDWKIDGYASGNWDFLYGTKRYLELFGSGRWGAMAANLYYDSDGPYSAKAGQRVLPPYQVRDINKVRVGIIGFTTDRGPSAGDGKATEGFRFTDGESELPKLVDTLRNIEKVDVVVVLSEFGLAKNVELADRHPGVDVLLSSDMHEETPNIVRSSTGTLISEVGQDGTLLGQLDLQVGNGGISGWRYTQHPVDASITPDKTTQAKIDKIRGEFVSGKNFKEHVNPINGTTLDVPIDTVVGQTTVPLYRGNFTDHAVPGVIEGTSHNMLADAFRDQTGADIGIIHGFRYGTHVAPGGIKLEDLYHFVPIGPSIAKATVTGQQIKDHLEKAINGVLSPDLSQWSAGWVPALSGVKYDLDAYRAQGDRVRNIVVYDRSSATWMPLDLAKHYTVGGYWYPQRPTNLGGGITIPDGSAQPVTSTTGEPLDATQVIAQYLNTHRAEPDLGRVRLVDALPRPAFGNKEIQPLRGVPTTR